MKQPSVRRIVAVSPELATGGYQGTPELVMRSLQIFDALSGVRHGLVVFR
jgi:hypothetical protein